jgi:hypothetical protein
MIRSQWRWLFTVLSILLWVALVYAGYYVVHRPVDATTLRALANGIADILTWLGLMLVATALGSRLTRTLAYHSLLERLAFSSGLGLALVSLLTLVLSLVGLLYGIVLWALLLGGGLALWPEIRRLRAALRERPRGPALDRWSRFLLGFVILSLVLVFLLALAPPAEWDALTYHLVGPARYLAAHRLTYEFDNYYRFTTHGWNEAMTYLAENRRPGDNVLFFWEPRGYDCAAPCEADVLFDNFSQLLARYHTVEGILTGLQQEGVTLVLVNEAIFPHIAADYPLAPQEATAWEEWQARVLTDENAVYRGASGLVLFRLPSVP